MSRESYIERMGNSSLRAAGWEVEKLGREGWPDRIAMKGSLFFLLEWKKPNGRLTKAQLRRIPKLRARGIPVAILFAIHEATNAAGWITLDQWHGTALFTGGI